MNDVIKSFDMPSRESTETNPQEWLKNKLQELAIAKKERYQVPVVILQSNAYCNLQERIEKCKLIPDADPLWEEIEKAVKECSPNFRRQLNLLTSGHLTVIDYHTALLLKCGIKPGQMAKLAGRSQGCIVSRRETLGFKIIGVKRGLAIVDRVIQSL